MAGLKGVLEKLVLPSKSGQSFLLKLTCLDAVGAGTSFRLEDFPALVGRGDDVHVHVEDTWASRHHCEIDRAGTELVVRDLASRNGTLVNGLKTTQSPLRPGDKLTVGLSTFEVRYNPKLLETLCPDDAEVDEFSGLNQ